MTGLVEETAMLSSNFVEVKESIFVSVRVGFVYLYYGIISGYFTILL